jgi:hypothetical protein
MLHSPSDDHYIDTIKKLALKPAIYGKLYNEYKGNLPSDATLKIKLIKDYEFNPESVDDFIANFKETMAHANLFGKVDTEGDASIQKNGAGEIQNPKQDVIMQTTMQTEQTGMQSYPIPISKMKKVIISFESLPVNKNDIKAIKNWLNLFSSSLTGIEEPEIDNDKEKPNTE